MFDWFRALLPKEDHFFDLFERHALLVLAGAESLHDAIDGGDGEGRHLRQVSDRETEADTVTREVLLAVRRSFITPFDRSAITALISALDDSIDQMQKCVARVRRIALCSLESGTAGIFDLRRETACGDIALAP